MPVKIRLQRRGRRKKPYYHIVVADARAPRDGRFIEKIGAYNPLTVPATIELDRDKALEWIQKGAQPTDTTRAILRFKGVLYRKHLLRGVSKGSFSMEEADKLYQIWIDEKEAKIATRRAQSAEKRKEALAAISGKPKKAQTPAPKKAESDSPFAKEEPKTFAESVEQTTIETAAAAAPAAAAVTPPAKEEKPAAEEKKEAAPAAEEKKEAAPAAEEKKEAAPAAKADDLKKIEGIGPKIAEVLNKGGILTFGKLAETPADKIKEILTAAEGNFAAHDPTTWPAQAKMAADGEWDKLKQWQDELDGGKPAKASGEEE